MNGIRAAVAALVLAILAAPAVAADDPGGNYLNTVTLSATTADSTVFFFNEAAPGTTSTAANREPVTVWSVHNTNFAAGFTLRLFGAWRPAKNPGAVIDFTYATGSFLDIPIPAGGTLNSGDVPVILHGFGFDAAPSQDVTIWGSNP